MRLVGVPGTCTLDGTNPAPVTITSDATTDLTFTVACSTTTGNVLVSVTSSGEPADANGYVATLDGAAPGQPIATAGNVPFTGVTAGSHTIALGDVAAGCSVTGGPSREVTVTVGATIDAAFVVTCAGTTGTIQATATTSRRFAGPGWLRPQRGRRYAPADRTGRSPHDSQRRSR